MYGITLKMPALTCSSVFSLYTGPTKVLTNTTTTFRNGTAILSGKEKNHVAGLELKETMMLCGRDAQKTHTKNIAVFFHLLTWKSVSSGKFNMVTTDDWVGAEFPAGRVDNDAAGNRTKAVRIGKELRQTDERENNRNVDMQGEEIQAPCSRGGVLFTC
jgi:hypothetical protein